MSLTTSELETLCLFEYLMNNNCIVNLLKSKNNFEILLGLEASRELNLDLSDYILGAL